MTRIYCLEFLPSRDRREKFMKTNYVRFFQPMVHCVSSSEPDSGETQLPSDEWRGNNQTAVTNLGKEPLPAQPGTPADAQQVPQQQQQASQPQQLQQQQQGQGQSQQSKPSFVESSTVSSGIQVGSLEQASGDDTRQLTLTDTTTQQQQQHHELADTTHLDNNNTNDTTTDITNLSPAPPPLPNHIIHSDTIIITESIREEFTSCDNDNNSNKDLVREPEQMSYHTMQPMLVEDDCASNNCDERLEASATTVLHHDVQKVYNVDLSSGLYPHLYSFKSEQSEEQQQQQLPLVEFQSTEKLQIQQQAYFGPLVINDPNLTDFVEDGAEEESATSTEEEDEEL